MKAFLTFFAAVLAASLFAADLTTTDGKIYHDATIISQTATQVTVKYAGGMVGIPKAKLPADLQALYPTKPEPVRVTKTVTKAAESVAPAQPEPTPEPVAPEIKQHEVEYIVSTHSQPASITFNDDTPEGKKETVKPSYDDWSKKVTLKDRMIARLDAKLPGTNWNDATCIIKVDGIEVRRASLHGGEALEMSWILADGEQPEVLVYDPTKPVDRQNSLRVISQTSGFSGKVELR